MPAVARSARTLVLALVGAALLASLLASAASAATLSVRLEAGRHVGYHFDTAWHVTSTRTVTWSRPTTASATSRTYVGSKAYLRISSGLLSGWWVLEDRMSWVRSIVGTKTYSPAAAVRLPAGRYETYAFGSTGALVDARGGSLAAATTVHVDRTSVMEGRRYLRMVDGPWSGRWLPGSTTAPQAISCIAGPKPSSTAGRTVSSVSKATGKMALTFDMGGRLDPALSILRYLELERACATIFPTGQAANTTVGRQVMAEIRAHPELFEVGNHTMHHCNLRDGGGGWSGCPSSPPSAAFIARELTDAEAVIRSLTGATTVPYWRPPYGAAGSAVIAAATAARYPLAIMWSTDTIDWRPVADGGPTAWQISSKILAGERAGGIILQHLGGYNTRDSLPATITGLLRDGYRPTTITGLFRS